MFCVQWQERWSRIGWKYRLHLKESVKNLHYDNCYLTKAHAIFFQSCHLAFKSTVSKNENPVAH